MDKKIKTRKKKLDDYKDIILSWLREHLDMWAAQVYDWLIDKYNGLQIAESNVRLYVRDLRKNHDISKVKMANSYESLPQLPMGAQAQVDFG